MLTAHPTEAKRITVLEQHRNLYLNLLKLENSMWTDSEKELMERTALTCPVAKSLHPDLMQVIEVKWK